MGSRKFVLAMFPASFSTGFQSIEDPILITRTMHVYLITIDEEIY